MRASQTLSNNSNKISKLVQYCTLAYSTVPRSLGGNWFFAFTDGAREARPLVREYLKVLLISNASAQSC